MSLKPVVVSHHSATSRLARFLDRLLRPIVQIETQSTMFKNGADFIRKLNRHTENPCRFHEKTVFILITVFNFHMMIPHGIMLITLTDFLHRCLPTPEIEDISVNRIIRLTALFLHYNRFYYDHKIYRFAKGSPKCFPFTETLLNIYLTQWQQLLIRDPLMQDQFFGR